MTAFTGTLWLTRFALRRDRLLLPVWIAIFTLMTVASASATKALYPDEASREVAALAINSVPTVIALYGRVWDPTSLGEISLIKLSGFGTVFVAILAIMLVVRHTRSDEEAGRTELIGSTVVGAWAQLASALLLATGTMLVLGAASSIGLIAIGLPAAGSLAFGAAWAVTGIVFAAIAALAAQVTTTGRAANALAMLVLALAYVLRAVGDATGDLTTPALWSWFSPIGWAQQVRAFAGDRFTVLLLPIALAGLLALAALLIAGRRDIGTGLIPERPGRAQAGPALGSVWGLAWRLQRGLLVGWALAYIVLSALIGSIVSSLTSMMNTPQVAAMVAALGGTDALVDAFTAMEFSVVAFITAAYGISVTRRLAAEETAGHAELVLAGAASRVSYLLSHVLIAIVGTSALCLLQGVVFALTDAAATGTSERIAASIGAALVWLPAIWLTIAVAVLLIGFAPRLVALAWAVLVAFLLIDEVGALLEWPQWVLDASPFAHIPLLPGQAMSWAPVAALTAIAVAVMAIGTARFTQRDLDTP